MVDYADNACLTTTSLRELKEETGLKKVKNLKYLFDSSFQSAESLSLPVARTKYFIFYKEKSTIL